MSTHPRPPALTDGGQLDMFADPAVEVPTQRIPSATQPARPESNDLDLVRDIAGNAARGVYLLVGATERVYARADPGTAVRVPGYEEATVHQLLRRGWLTTGNGNHHVTCGAAHLTGTAVLVPKSTRAQLARWAALVKIR